MGGVAVLHPQDCLKEPFSNKALILSRDTKRPFRNPNPNPNLNPKVNRTNRRKRSPTGTGETVRSRSPPSPTMVAKTPAAAAAKSLVLGQVKILKRGEDLPPTTTTTTTTSDRASDVGKVENMEEDRADDPVLQATDRLGPDPEIVSKQIGILSGFYAGSAFFTSPPPSSVPLPGFFSRNKAATTDLLSMLRLNLT